MFALLVRLVVALDARDAPYWTAPTMDEWVYLENAQKMVAGIAPANGAYYVAPGYTWVLAAALKLGGGVLAAKILNLIAGAVSAALVALLAQRFFGGGVALVAGLAWALYPSQLLQELLLQKSALTVLLVLACALCVARSVPAGAVAGHRSSPGKPIRGTGAWGAGGFFLGLAVLLRPELLIAGAALTIAAWVARARLWPLAPTPRAIVLFLVGLLAPVTVPTLQNLARSGDLVVAAYGGGPNFYIGNHAGAEGGYEPLRPDRGDPRLEESDAVLLANTATGRMLSPAAVSRYWFRRALSWWRAEPAAAVRLTIKKWALLWGSRELADGVSTRLAGRWVALLRNPIVGPALVLPAALLGMWLLRRRRELWGIHALLVGLQVAIVPFFLFERFRLALVALSLPFASATGAAAVGAIHKRKWWPLVAGIVAVVGTGFALAQAEIPIDENVHRAHLGAMLFEAGRYGEAVQELESVRAASPAYWRIDDNLAAAYAALHDHDQAMAALQRFLRNLQNERATTGLVSEEELTYAHELAGDIELDRKRISQAEEHYQAALQYAKALDQARLRAKLEQVARLRAPGETPPPDSAAPWRP